MQNEKKNYKITKFMKAKDDHDQLQQGLNSHIRQGLGEKYESVTDSTKALIILNINTKLY